MVDYTKQATRDLGPDSPIGNFGVRNFDGSGSDTDFQARDAESDGEESGDEAGGQVLLEELEAQSRTRLVSAVHAPHQSPSNRGM